MKSLLISILETICPNNVYLQGTLNPNVAYPESFITFFCDDTPEDDFYDDEPQSVIWSFSVIFYSSNPALVGTQPPAIIAALKQGGFIPQGRGHDIPSDRVTHTGWAMDFTIRQTL